MTSKKSFYDLLRDGLRRNLWAIVLSGLGFFFTLLLPELMVMQRVLEDLNMAKSVGEMQYKAMWEGALDDVKVAIGPKNAAVVLAFIVLAAVLGITMFSYLHSRQKVDFYHSLPLSRTKLFCSNFVTGILCAVPMYFIMLVITLICVNAMGFSEAISANLILGAVLDNMVCFFIIYALTVLTTVLCGNTIITLLLWLWVMFSPLLIKALQIGLYSHFYRTFQETARDEMWIYRLSPVVQYFMFDGTGTVNSIDPKAGVPVLIAYTVIAVLAALLALRLFKIRKSERSGMALAFEPIKLPIKVYMCAVIGVSAALFLNTTGGDFWFWPGLVLGVVLFHMVVEIIYAFDFKAILSKPVEMGIILAVTAVVMFALKMDITGFDKWLPSEDSVQAVDIDEMGYNINEEKISITDKETVKAVRRIAELGIEYSQMSKELAREKTLEASQAVSEYVPEDERFQNFVINYKLSNGSLKARSYNLPYTDELEELVAKITNSAEFKIAKWDVFKYEKQLNERISGNKDASTGYREPYLAAYNEACTGDPAMLFGSNKEDIMKILQTYEQEALTRTEKGDPVIKLEFGWHFRDNKNDRVEHARAYVTKADVKTLALLKQLMNIEPEPIPVNKIKKAELDYSWETGNETIDVTDESDLKKLYENAINDSAIGSTSDFWDSMKHGMNYTAYRNGCSASLAIDDNGKINYISISWPVGKVPEDVIEKYRPEEMKEAENNETEIYDEFTEDAVMTNSW